MKRILIIAALSFAALLVSQGVSAQSNEFKEFMEDYSGVEGITVMDISSEMLRLSGVGKGDQAASDLISKITRLVVIANDVPFAFAPEIDKMLREGEYQVLSSIVEGSSKTKICMGEVKRGENELIIFTQQGHKCVLVCIVGKLSIDQMIEVSGGIL